ncbi:hypothetical protein O181_119518 [Austropuccinia psidii MF-1]|uniref:Uncharacterized protein n=1 Tax=Austropuccinia psidii MF-1 TaxID=1389203 RepID=A0A9Q3KEA5_9BASI|nr:hypothetical protein [Austropuccinia psidii MF-1]
MAIVNIINPPDRLSLRYYSIISHVAQLTSYPWQSPQGRENFAMTVKLIYDGPKPTNSNALLFHVHTLWNSTYYMLEKALCLREAYNQYCSPESMKSFCVTPIEWEKVEVTACQKYNVEPIEASSLTKYLMLLLCKTAVICASILDPHFKMKFFTAHDTALAQFGTSANALAKSFEGKAQKQCTRVNNPPPEPEFNGQSGLFDKMYSARWLKGGTVESEIQRFLAEALNPNLLIYSYFGSPVVAFSHIFLSWLTHI